MKILKYFLLILIILIISISSIFQIKAHKYLKLVQNKYGVFKDKERIRHIPIVVFYIKSKWNYEYYSEYFKYADIPFLQKGLKNYWFNPLFSAYYSFSYYDLNELTVLNNKLRKL